MKIWITILGMAIVTYGTRYSPMTIIREDALPTWARRGLAYVPVAVLCAIIGPAFLPHEKWGEFTIDAHLIAGIVAIAVAWYTRSTILTIVVGMALLLLLG